MNQRSTLSNGLNLLFVASIVALFGAIPGIGGIITIAAAVVKIYALFTLKEEHANFNTAFMVAIAALAVSALLVVFDDGILGTLVSLAGTVVNLFYVYLICTTIDEIADARGAVLSPNGKTIWSLSLVANVIVIAATLIAVIPFLLFLAGVAAIIGALVALVAGIMMFMLLYKASRAFE